MRRVNGFLACVLFLLVAIGTLRPSVEGLGNVGLTVASGSARPAVATVAPLLDEPVPPTDPERDPPEDPADRTTKATLEAKRCARGDKEPPYVATRERGTPAEWRAAYEGISGADPHDPPALLPHAKATQLPTATLVFERAEALVSLSLPSGTERVFDPGGARDRHPVWSADGQWLFFISDSEERARFGERAPWRVFRMRADGTERQAVSGPFCEQSSSWAVSPDGGHLAYVVPTFRAPSYQRTQTLRLVDIAWHEDREVEDGFHLTAPTFSKDGRTLFYGGSDGEDAMFSPTKLTAHALGSRRSTVFPQPKLTFVDSLHDLGDGRLLFVGDPERSLCCRQPGARVLDLRTGVTAPLGSGWAGIGFLRLRPSGDNQGFLADFSRRGVGGSFADVQHHVAHLDGRGKSWRTLGNGFPVPFYSADAPAFLPDARYVVFTLTLSPWRDGSYSENTLVLADLQRDPQAPLVELATGDAVAVRPPQAE